MSCLQMAPQTQAEHGPTCIRLRRAGSHLHSDPNEKSASNPKTVLVTGRGYPCQTSKLTLKKEQKTKLCGFSPGADYTERPLLLREVSADFCE
jgi:hypothetical protein